MKKITIPKSNANENCTIDIENNIVIVGANGAGKSRFGSKIEAFNSPTKRISAQRQLQLIDTIPKIDFESASNQLRNSNKNQSPIHPHNDYQQVLMSLFAQQNKRDSEFVNASRLSTEKVPIPNSTIESVLEIWNFVLPYRILQLENDRITVNSDAIIFPGTEMSDGEKVCLYLISQILLADKDCILIIDEPELHLHKALMVRLWNKLEEHRNDCTFIYITHDLDFAVSKQSSKLIWIQKFKNETWEWQFIESNDFIPENLFLEILGSRKPILFVEGDKGSLDAKIYQAYYENFTIIPCGSCEKVIEAVRSLKAHPQLIHIAINGLIDKDFRPTAQLIALQADGIFSTHLCEIENIFLAPEIIEMVCNHLLQPGQKNAIENEIKTIYTSNRDQAIFAATKYLMHRRIGEVFGKIKKISEYETIKTTLFNELDTLTVDNFPNSEASLIEILKFYPHKGLTKLIQGKLSQTGSGYTDLVLGFLSTDKRKDLVQVLTTYLPTISIQNSVL